MMQRLSFSVLSIVVSVLLASQSAPAATTTTNTTKKKASAVVSTKTTPKTTTKAAAKTPAKSAVPAGTIYKDPYLGAIVVDAASGTPLFQDNPDVRGRPASSLKLMDLLLITEQIERGQLSLTDSVPVSARATRAGGSQVWLKEHEVFTVDEMLYALMVQSANDAAVALAERSAGSVEAFVDLMNRRAKELGMNNTVVRTVHGLPPSKGQEPDEMSPRDLSILCRELLKHPDVLRYTSTKTHTFRPGSPAHVDMRNHDHLLGSVVGCDGFKTGYYAKAGYTIALTAQRNGQRVIAIVMNSPTLKKRDAKATALINQGFVTLLDSQPPTAPAPAAPSAAPGMPARAGAPAVNALPAGSPIPSLGSPAAPPPPAPVPAKK